MLLVLKSKFFLSIAACLCIKIIFFNCACVCTFYRNANDVITKMNIIFDKSAYEKGQSINLNQNNDIANDNNPDDGMIIQKALLDTLATGKVGDLFVDPNYLDFEALECKYLQLIK